MLGWKKHSRQSNTLDDADRRSQLRCLAPNNYRHHIMVSLRQTRLQPAHLDRLLWLVHNSLLISPHIKWSQIVQMILFNVSTKPMMKKMSNIAIHVVLSSKISWIVLCRDHPTHQMVSLIFPIVLLCRLKDTKWLLKGKGYVNVCH